MPLAQLAPDAAPRRTFWPLLTAAVLALLYLAGELYLLDGRLGLTLDDSWIHLQFARQLAQGAGLTYNPGQWVAGSTAPLWTALLSLAFLLPGPLLIWVKAFGVLGLLATVQATVRLAAELGLRAGWGQLAGFLVATTHWLLWSALSGMEVLLFTALSLWGILLHLRERTQPGRLPLSLPVLAAAALARPEGLYLLGLAIGEQVLFQATTRVPPGDRSKGATRWSVVGEGGLLAALVALPVFLTYRLLGGSFLPTTFAVKTAAGGGVSLFNEFFNERYLQAVLSIFFRSQPLLLLAAGAGILRLLARLGSRRDPGCLAWAWFLGLPLASSALSAGAGPVLVGNFGRYFFPLLPLVIVFGLLGCEPVVRRFRAPLTRHPLLRVLLLAVLFAHPVWSLAHGILRHAQTIANVEDSDVRAAHWLAPRLPPTAILAVQDIGALKFFLPNPVVDLTGIVNPEILPYLRGSADDPRYWEERLLRYLAEQRPAPPDYLVVFAASYPQLIQQPGMTVVKRFPVPNNVTMAGDEVVIVATPYCRFPLHDDPQATASPRP